RVLWVPAEWPHPRLEHWRTLLRARAIENQFFVVAANRCGTGDNSNWCGHSTIIDPWGNVLAEAEEEETVLVADLEMGLVDEVRKRIPCFEVVEGANLRTKTLQQAGELAGDETLSQMRAAIYAKRGRPEADTD